MTDVTERETVQEGATRHGFIKKVTAASAAVFAGIAAVGATKAAAYPYHCCALARDNRCAGCTNGSSSFRCPSGYHKKYWVCCENDGLYGCGECASGSNCFIGPWACSCGFPLAGPCI